MAGWLRGLLDAEPIERDPAYEYGGILPYRMNKATRAVDWAPQYSELVKGAWDAVRAPMQAWSGEPVGVEDALNVALNMSGGGVVAGKVPRGAVGMAGRAQKPRKAPNIKFSKETTAAYGGQTNHTLRATTPEGAVGTLDYTVYNGEPAISMVRVPEGSRRQGIGQSLVKQLQQEFPHKEINWGMMTDEGAALRSSLPFHTVETEAAPLMRKLQQVRAQLAELERKANAGAITQDEGAFWNTLHDREYDLLAQIGNSKPTKQIVGHNYPQAQALETARQNAVKMLGLPENNTPLDRARALAQVTQDNAAARAHQFANLEFQAIPLKDFRGKPLHKSPSFNGKQSSEYRLGEVSGEPAYLRKSNHWGKFATNVLDDSQLGVQLRDLTGESDDMFGRVGSTANNWQLRGGKADAAAERISTLRAKYDALPAGSQERFDTLGELLQLENPKVSQAGYVPLHELVGRVPGKVSYFSGQDGNFAVPTVTLNNGKLRSRFAAFDPARIDENDLLAMRGLPALRYWGLLQDEPQD